MQILAQTKDLPTARTRRLLIVVVLAVAAAWVPLLHPDSAGAAPATGWVGPGVGAYGDAPNLGAVTGTLHAPPVALVASPDGKGYWIATADGEVRAFGDAKPVGSLPIVPHAPIVGMAATPDGGGYWLVGMDGGVFAFGDARFWGSTGALKLNQPVVGMAASRDGGGYWLVAADGGIFAFGDAGFFGSAGNIRLVAPIVAMAATRDGRGYWLAASDGGVFTFGDAVFKGSAADADIGTWIAGMQATPDGQGYWLAAATGGVLTYGDAQFFGPTPNLPPFSPVTAIAATPDGGGYWLLRQDEISVALSSPLFAGPALAGGENVVGIAASQLGPNGMARQGPFCNPYGPCEEWCALFATWVWESAGIPIPRYPFTGSIFDWGVAHGRVLPPSAVPAPGDLVLYGTGPQSTSTSVHVGIVAQVWPDGAIDTIEGDSGPEPEGQFGVTINGPFLPLYSEEANGMPVYAFVAP